jgi:hypothetical protein
MGLSLLSTFLLTYWSTSIASKISASAKAWYQFPDIWENITWLCSYLNLFFISVITIIIVCNEYTYRTIRQNVIDGLSRFELFFAKIQLIVFLSLCLSLFTGIVCLVFGLIYSEGNLTFINIFKKTTYLADFFLQAIAYGIMAYAIAVIFKQTGIAIVMFFVYKVIIESIIDWKILSANYGDFLPMNLFSELTPKPFAKMAETSFSKLGIQAYSIHSPNIELLTILYILIISSGIYFLILKRDL